MGRREITVVETITHSVREKNRTIGHYTLATIILVLIVLASFLTLFQKISKEDMFTISLDKSSYLPGENIRVKVINNADFVVKLWEYGWEFYRFDEDVDNWVLYIPENGVPILEPWWSMIPLDPGKSWIHWITAPTVEGKYRLYGYVTQENDGTYAAFAELFVSVED